MTTVPYRDLDVVLLDLGNTLIAMDPALVCDALRAEGVAATPESFVRAEAGARPALSAWLARGGSTEGEPTIVVYVREMLACLGAGDGDATGLARRLAARMRQVPTTRLWSRVLPGVPDALALLRGAGLRLVVVSNSDGTAEAGMVALGLRPLVDAVVDSAFFGAEKPDRRIFEHALAIAGARAERAAYVGDLYAVDVVGARGAGMHPVLLDPFGDWDGADCERVTDVAELARRIVEARA